MAAPLQLELLAEELIVLALRPLGPRDLCQVAQTSTLLRRIAGLGALWEPLFEELWWDKQDAAAGVRICGRLMGASDPPAEPLSSGAPDRWKLAYVESLRASHSTDLTTDTLCGLQWRMRFSMSAGGDSRSPSRACVFGQSGLEKTLQLEGYPPMSWSIETADSTAEGKGSHGRHCHSSPAHM